MAVQNGAVQTKSKAFALRVIKLYHYLCRDKHEYVISKQLLRSGLSIGANIAEAEYGQTKADFYAKMHIALKETAESKYWLELLHESEILSTREFTSIYDEANELMRLLVSIVKTK